MSIPSLSCAVQIGVIVSRASAVSRHLDPAIEPESSIRKTVSKLVRKAYGSSAPCELAGVADTPGNGAALGAGE